MLRIVVVLFFLLFSTSVHAIGRGPGARAAAMGGAYSAIAYGIESYGYNPAGMASDKSFSVLLGSGGNSTLTLQQAQELYTQLSTTVGRSQYMIDNILEEIKIIGQGDLPFFGISMGNLGVATWGYAYAYADKRAIDYQFILLGGYILEYGLIYGDSFGKLYKPLEDLYWGTTVRGFTGGERLLYYSALNWASVGDTLVNYASEGSTMWNNGASSDLGLKYQGPNYAVAFALKDLGMAFDQTYDYDYRQVDFDSGTLGGIIGTYEATSRETQDSWWILGLAYYLEEPGVLVTSDIKSYKTSAISPSDSDFGNTIAVTDIHLGIEKKIVDWLALRGGLSSENFSKLAELWTTYGLGFNFDNFNLDLAAGSSSLGNQQVYLQGQTVI